MPSEFYLLSHFDWNNWISDEAPILVSFGSKLFAKIFNGLPTVMSSSTIMQNLVNEFEDFNLWITITIDVQNVQSSSNCLRSYNRKLIIYKFSNLQDFFFPSQFEISQGQKWSFVNLVPCILYFFFLLKIVLLMS